MEKPETISNTISVQVGPHIFSFENFNDWCDTAKGKFKNFGQTHSTVLCVDQKGRICLSGKEFKKAEDEQAYPINVYITLPGWQPRICRACECVADEDGTCGCNPVGA